MAKRGRPPVLDELKRREICAILAIGSTRQVAAKFVGCSVETIRRTAVKDPVFFEQLRVAESQHEVKYLQCIHNAAQKEQYWRAAAWALERKYPDRYAARPPGTVTPEQVSYVLNQFAEILVERIPDPNLRNDVVQHLKACLSALQDTPPSPPPRLLPAE